MASAIATRSVAVERRSSARHPARLDATVKAAGPGIVNAIRASGWPRHMLGWLEDAGLLVVLVFAFPLVILVVGTPVVLVVRLLLEIGRRLW
jgi:hypothetical protein